MHIALFRIRKIHQECGPQFLDQPLKYNNTVLKIFNNFFLHYVLSRLLYIFIRSYSLKNIHFDYLSLLNISSVEFPVLPFSEMSVRMIFYRDISGISIKVSEAKHDRFPTGSNLGWKKTKCEGSLQSRTC
jgi:hypothetical protein